jgi:hypothetical protein
LLRPKFKGEAVVITKRLEYFNQDEEPANIEKFKKELVFFFFSTLYYILIFFLLFMKDENGKVELDYPESFLKFLDVINKDAAAGFELG